jgi:hypothetical protein
MMTAHKHADVLIALANGQEIQYTPHTDISWSDYVERNPINFSPLYCTENVIWRVKPKTIRIGERDVPEPMRVAPATGTVIWMPSIWYQTKASSLTWCNTSENTIRIERGLCHDNREAAIAHAEALILISGGTL